MSVDEMDRAMWTDGAADGGVAGVDLSRYGMYLAYRAAQFGGERCPARFAVLAAEVAAEQVMSPPYLVTHPRLCGWYGYADQEGRTAVDVAVAVPLPAVFASAMGRHNWGGWARITWDQRRFVWVSPYDAGQAAAWTTITVRVPLDAAGLPTPVYDADGTPDVDVARRAVRALAMRVNEALGGLLAGLPA
jgi:hypothetical protein